MQVTYTSISKEVIGCMLTIAFCDDDNRFLEKIVPKAGQILKKLKVNAVIYTFTNGEALIKSLEKHTHYYDIIFLDIEMPHLGGKETARRLRLLDKKFKLVFLTSFEEEVLNTFQYDVSDFTPKFLVQERLYSVIKRLVEKIREDDPKPQTFKVRDSQDKISVIKMPLYDIEYFESIDRKIYLHTKRRVYLLHNYKFTDLAGQYSKFDFVDIHRTCIVNIKYIFSIEDTSIRLDDGTILPLSRRKRQQVLDKYLKIICEVDE